MLGRTHALSGAVAVLALTPVLRAHGVTIDAWAVPVAAVTAAGAAILPDLDHAHATPARSLGPLTAGLAWCVGAVSGGHRNGTHSILGLAAFTWLAVFLTHLGGLPLGLFLSFLFAIASAALRVTMVRATVGHTLLCLLMGAMLTRGALLDSFPVEVVPWAVATGVTVHLIGDMATIQGCPLFWPFHGHRYNYLTLSTDHAVERYVVGPALTLAAAWLVVTLAGGVDVIGPALQATWRTVRAVVPS